jgi:hypothetical protein
LASCPALGLILFKSSPLGPIFYKRNILERLFDGKAAPT